MVTTLCMYITYTSWLISCIWNGRIEILYYRFNVTTFLIQWTARQLANYTSCSLNLCKGETRGGMISATHSKWVIYE